jgi:hypothetical protein
MNPILAGERPRNMAYALIWTAQSEPVHPATLYDALYGRGFLPGFTDPAATIAPMADAGLADARFEVGGEGYRILSMTSSKGEGCRISVHAATVESLPDDYLARRAVPRPRLVYVVESGGPSNSDRNLCENMAEALMMMTNGVVLLGGLGTKGNKPLLHTSSWLGEIKTVARNLPQ